MVIHSSEQVLQEVLRAYSVPENSFGKVCVIIDKVSRKKILAAGLVHINHRHQILVTDYILVLGSL